MYHSDLVSVILPCYNAQKYIDETLQSIFDQTYQNIEIIIIDDNSIDNTVPIIREKIINRKNVKFIKNSKRLFSTRNIGIKYSKGRFLCFIDHDDIWNKNKILKQVKFHNKRKCSLSCTYFRRFDNEGNIGILQIAPNKITYENLLKQNCICMSSVMIDKTQCENFQFLAPPLNDFSTWLYLAKNKHILLTISEDLTRYRVHPNSESFKKIKIIKERWYVLRVVEKLSMINSIKFFIYYIFKSYKKYKFF